MSSVCCLRLHHTSASIPVKLPAGRSSISLVCTCDRDTARLSKKKPLCDILPAALPCPLSAYARAPSPQRKFSIRQRCVSVKVTMVICTPGGTHSGVLVQCSQMERGWIPIRGLTFPGRPSNGVLPRGQESCASGLFPRGLEESYEQKVKAGGRLKWRGVALIVLVWGCLKKVVLVIDELVFLHF